MKEILDKGTVEVISRAINIGETGNRKIFMFVGEPTRRRNPRNQLHRALSGTGMRYA
jgi:hypothetical protein